jgi:flagellin-like protein
LRYYGHNRSRRAASEVIGAILAISITLVAGAAAWGYVRAQAGASETAMQNGAVNTNNLLSEHFGVVDMYFGTSTSATFWVYNTGSLTYQTYSVRIYSSTTSVNLLYNFTQSGGVKTDQVYDLRSALANKCKTAAASYETPSLTGSTVKLTNAQFFTLTIPPTSGSCPSFGQTITAGTTYTVVVTGIYGNVVTYSQTD